MDPGLGVSVFFCWLDRDGQCLDSLEVSVDRLQVFLEFGYKLLLAALQRLAVLHAVLQELEHAAHAGAQCLDAADGVRKRIQVHSDIHHVRHLLCFPPRCWRALMTFRKAFKKN